MAHISKLSATLRTVTERTSHRIKHLEIIKNKQLKQNEMKKTITILAVVLITTNLFAQLPSYVPTTGLVGYYPFTGNANDVSGNANNGTVNGATLTSDRFGSLNCAYHFTSSTTNKISLPTVNTNNILKYSISGWFQYNSTAYGGTIFGQSNGCNGADGLRFYMGTDSLLFWDAEYTSTFCSGKGTHQSNHSYHNDITWHFFAATFDGIAGIIHSNEFKLYVDNILVSQPTDSVGGGILSAVIAPIVNSIQSTTIGNTNNATDAFNGNIDDIGIWQRVLTQQEISNLYTNSVDSCHFAVYDTTHVTSYDTIHLTAYDTTHISVYDTTHLSVYDTTHLSVYDTTHIVVNDTIHYSAYDTTHLNVYDTIFVYDTLHVVGINVLNNTNTMKIYPNPTSHNITIDNGNYTLMEGYSIKITNTLGQIVYLKAINEPQFNIDLASWTGHGTYYVYIIDPQNKIIELSKIIYQ